MEITSIKSSAFYGYTATGSNATITGTFTTSSLPVIEVDGMYVTTNVLSTVTTYTETTLTEYTSYTSTSSWSETVSSFSSAGRRISTSQASHLGETFSTLESSQLTLYDNYYSATITEVGYNTVSTILHTGTTEVNGTNIITSESSSFYSSSSVNTTGNSYTNTFSGTKFSRYDVYSYEYYSALYTLSYSSGSMFKATQFLVSRDSLITAAYINDRRVTSLIRALNDILGTYAVLFGNSTLESTATSAREAFSSHTLLYSGMFNSASVTN